MNTLDILVFVSTIVWYVWWEIFWLQNYPQNSWLGFISYINKWKSDIGKNYNKRLNILIYISFYIILAEEPGTTQDKNIYTKAHFV